MDLGLDGKVAVVTGAGKGIGLAVTKELADEGALVVAGSRTIDSLEGLERVTPVAVEGRESAVWGQPQLTAYLRWKWQARRRRNERRIPALS